MRPSITLLAICFSLLTINNEAFAQNNYTPDSTGSINFNLGNSTLRQPKHQTQTLSLFSCNTSLTVNSKLWKGPKKGFEWQKKNQILKGIPFGYQTDTKTKDSFYISTYYIASPPLFQKGPHGGPIPNSKYDIGIVTPNEFNFTGDNPKKVDMNYNLLEPVYIEYIDVVYGSSFDKLGVSFIPFKVEANNFPWIETPTTIDSLGATGIGAVYKDSTNLG
jgi:hypothetical protein